MVSRPVTSLSRRFRSHILATLGLTPLSLALACSPSPGSDSSSGSGGVTTDPSGSADAEVGDDDGDTINDEDDGSDDATATATSTSTTTDDDGSDDGVKLDLPGSGLCTANFISWEEADSFEGCALELGEFCEPTPVLGCVIPEPGQDCADLCVDGDCVGDWYSCTPDSPWEMDGTFCGPYEIDGACCSVGLSVFCGEGRPFLVDGRLQTARLIAGEARAHAPELSPALRDRLATRWTEIALAEHASIASFARFTAELLALGAPPDLVRESAQAAIDEQRHAHEARRLAERWTGRTLRFGALTVTGCYGRTPKGKHHRGCLSLAEATEAAILEGCIGETLSALELAALAEGVDDPHLAATLSRIADDELRHATLAWRFVQWALERDPNLRERAAAAFASTPTPQLEDQLFADDPDTARALRRHGWQSLAERQRCWTEGRRNLITPCAEALLG